MPSSSQQNITGTEDPMKAFASWDVNNANVASMLINNSDNLPHNFDLNVAPEEARSQDVEIVSIPHPYDQGNQHMLASGNDHSSTLPSSSGGPLRRSREAAGNAESFQRNTRMRNDNGATSMLPNLGPNWFHNSQFEIGSSSSSSRESPGDGPSNPIWTVPQTQLPCPSRASNENWPLSLLHHAAWATLLADIETWLYASSNPASSTFFNQAPLDHPQSFTSYSSQSLLCYNAPFVNTSQLFGLVQHLINANLESFQPPPLSFVQVNSTVGNVLPTMFNPMPTRVVVGPPLLQQLNILNPGPNNGFPPQELHNMNYVIYEDEAYESEYEWEELELDVDNMSYEGLVDLEEEMGYVGGITKEAIMQNLRSTNYVTKNDADEACCICLEDYKEGDKLGKINCNHSYHFHCINEWLLTKNNCPICKSTALAV